MMSRTNAPTQTNRGSRTTSCYRLAANKPAILLIPCLAFVLLQTACVRRTVTINTEPQGALIWLNDEEVGRSPVTTDFLWYGDYDVVARLGGHQTLKTHHVLKAPWYEWVVIDFFSEILYPGKIHDQRTMEFVLEPEVLPDQNELLGRAEEFRERTLFETE